MPAEPPGLLGYHISAGVEFLGRDPLFRSREYVSFHDRSVHHSRHPDATTDPAAIAAYYDKSVPPDVEQAVKNGRIKREVPPPIIIRHEQQEMLTAFVTEQLRHGVVPYAYASKTQRSDVSQKKTAPKRDAASTRPRARAALHHIFSPKEAWVIAGTQYVHIRIQTAALKDRRFHGPTSVQEMEVAKLSGFEDVDAVLDLPGSRRRVQYFFSGSRCAWGLFEGLSPVKMTMFGPPREITVVWQSLRQVGFTTIDTVIPSPEGAWYFYVFRGSEYAYIRVHDDMRDELLSGPGPKSVWENWPSIKAAGFSTIDTALRSPEHVEDGHTYIFSGSEYALISIFPGTANDRLLRGPRSVALDWPSLAGFY